jgi:hypothetical protein
MERTTVEVEALGEVRGEVREGQSVMRTGKDEVDKGKGLEVVLVRVHELFEGVVAMALRHVLRGGGFAPAVEEEETPWKRPRGTKHSFVLVLELYTEKREKKNLTKEQK